MQKYVIALYIRLSLEDYKYDSMSIENQHLVLNEFVSSMPESTDAEVLEFIDNGYSGTNFERPKVQELIELVRANQIDCIIVKDFSRFGRNSIETGYFIERVFPLFHTRFISINDDFDSDQHKGDTGGMDVAFKYLISEYYSRDMSMKTKSAKYAKMQRGEYQSKICPYGYRKSADGRMEPNPETAAVVQLIFQLAATGIGAAAITRELFKRGVPTPGEYKAAHGQQYHDVSRSRGRWSSSTVLRILEDERYIGSYVIGRRAVIEVGGTRSRMKDRDKWFIIPDHHPAIIDEELFETVQEIRRANAAQKEKGVKKGSKPFSGRILCGECGRFFRVRNSKHYPVWFCPTAEIYNGKRICHTERVYEEQIVRAFRKAIIERFRLSAQPIHDNVEVADIMSGRYGEQFEGFTKEADDFVPQMIKRLENIQHTDFMERDRAFYKRQIATLQIGMESSGKKLRLLESQNDVMQTRRELLGDESIDEAVIQSNAEKIRRLKEKLDRDMDEKKHLEERLEYLEGYWEDLENDHERRERAIEWMKELPKGRDGVVQFLNGVTSDYCKAFVLSITVHSPLNYTVHWYDDTRTEVVMYSNIEDYRYTASYFDGQAMRDNCYRKKYVKKG